jgi:hypothetical protein
MPNAQSEVKAVYPHAVVERGILGLVVLEHHDGPPLSEGLAYWEEEAWMEAADEVFRRSEDALKKPK